MFKLIELLRSKPSDRNIRIIRIIFALILLGVIIFGFRKTSFEYASIPSEILYILFIFPALGLLRGLFDPGIFRKKIWKWTQVGLGVTMMALSFFLLETDTTVSSSSPLVTSSGSVSATALIAPDVRESRAVDTDFWIGFLGFWLALAGLLFASKNITLKNERYGEKVKKIRV